MLSHWKLKQWNQQVGEMVIGLLFQRLISVYNYARMRNHTESMDAVLLKFDGTVISQFHSFILLAASSELSSSLIHVGDRFSINVYIYVKFREMIENSN